MIDALVENSFRYENIFRYLLNTKCISSRDDFRIDQVSSPWVVSGQYSYTGTINYVNTEIIT